MYLLKGYLALVILVAVSSAYADTPHETLNVFRNAEGQLTSESKRNAEQLQTVAADAGYIYLWLTTRVPFNANEAELSPRQIAAQQQRVIEEFRKILQPVISAGIVRRDPARPAVEGPGLSVIATAEGLARLVADPRLLNISWTR